MTTWTGSTGADLARWWAGGADAELPPAWRGHPALAARRTVSEAEEAARTGSDAVLAALLRLLQDGEQQAGLVVMKALWTRLARAARGRSARADELAAPFWLVMAAYPLDRRPARIAANLVWDTLKAARTDPRERPVAPETMDSLATAPAADPVPTGDRVLARAQRLGLIDGRAARILSSVYLDGMPGRVAAVRHVTTETAIRWRCSSSVRRLAANAERLLAA
ncbi:hypothetical protein [Propionicicella superfundia]|uniref:hypothetical protein n=1 Tax=Propionicicella superfundia TaxID=348582 RepID=UPI00048A9382|nr:hypothetical protein [Propionicicella superfundia]